MSYLSDDEYMLIFSKVPRLCVDLLIKKDNGFIISKREIEPHKGMWHFPGGRLLYKETITDAIKRIGTEELGIEVDNQRLIGFIEFLNDGEFVHSISLVFLTRYISGKIKGSYQAKEIMNISSLPNKESFHPAQYLFLKEHQSELFN